MKYFHWVKSYHHELPFLKQMSPPVRNKEKHNDNDGLIIDKAQGFWFLHTVIKSEFKNNQSSLT